jgi:hypothetical protein
MEGGLATPIQVNVTRPTGLAVTDATIDKANEEMERLVSEAVGADLIKRLHLLMEHYDIAERDDWFSLALALAIDHVRPGFQIEWPLVAMRVDFEPTSDSKGFEGGSG